MLAHVDRNLRKPKVFGGFRSLRRSIGVISKVHIAIFLGKFVDTFTGIWAIRECVDFLWGHAELEVTKSVNGFGCISRETERNHDVWEVKPKCADRLSKQPLVHEQGIFPQKPKSKNRNCRKSKRFCSIKQHIRPRRPKAILGKAKITIWSNEETGVCRESLYK